MQPFKDFGGLLKAMAESYKPLATWKTWWNFDMVGRIARSLQEHVERLPAQGRLLTHATFGAAEVKDKHVACVAEALLLSYPSDKQPSAYLLGDAILELDKAWGHSLLGSVQENPVRERSRRDDALSQGVQLKKLLSYMRTSARRADLGRCEEVTYLKSLANRRIVKPRGSPASASGSTGSTTTGSPSSASAMSAQPS